MPIVSFWSSTKRETAQTLSMIAIACHMAVENNTKILMVTDSKFKKLVNYMYLNCNIYLDRKFQRFESSSAVLDRNI